MVEETFSSIKPAAEKKGVKFLPAYERSAAQIEQQQKKESLLLVCVYFTWQSDLILVELENLKFKRQSRWRFASHAWNRREFP